MKKFDIPQEQHKKILQELEYASLDKNNYEDAELVFEQYDTGKYGVVVYMNMSDDIKKVPISHIYTRSKDVEIIDVYITDTGTNIEIETSHGKAEIMVRDK